MPDDKNMIVLKKFTTTDIPELLDWIKDTDAMFLMQFAGPKYRYPLDKEQLLETLHDNTFLVFKAIEQETNKMVGHCQLMRIDLDSKTASIGRVLIKPEKRGFGYGSEMLEQLVKYSKKNLKLKHLNLQVFDFNKSAYKCYLKYGFIESKRENLFFNNIKKTLTCITMNYSIV